MTEESKNKKEGGYDKELMYLIIGILFITGCWFFWTYARQVIVYPAFMLDWVSIKLIETIKGLGYRGNETLQFIEATLQGNLNIHQVVTWEVFKEVRMRVGMQTRFVIAGLIFCSALLVYWKMNGKKFNRKFSLAGGKNQPLSFNSYQAKFWKVASFGASFDPDDTDNEIAPAYTPMEWLEVYNIPFEDGQFDIDIVTGLFLKQLGKIWNGFSEANLSVQTVLIICTLHLLRRKEALCVRETISSAWANGKNGSAVSKNIIEKYSTDVEVDYVISTITQRHGYENTAVIGLLHRSREIGGVLASSDFLWLRKTDRNLWYAINNTGRRRFHIEGAATMDHYFTENFHQCAILEPQISEAINGLTEYLESHGIDSLSDFKRNREQDEISTL